MEYEQGWKYYCRCSLCLKVLKLMSITMSVSVQLIAAAVSTLKLLKLMPSLMSECDIADAFST